MDEIRLESESLKKLVSKIVQSAIEKKLSVDLGIQLDQLHASHSDNNKLIELQIGGVIRLSEQELTKLLCKFGLDMS